MSIDSTLVDTPWMCTRCDHAGRVLLSAHVDVVSAANLIMGSHHDTSPDCDGDLSTVRVLYELRKVEDQTVEFGKLELHEGDVLVLDCPAAWRPEQCQEYFRSVSFHLAATLDHPPLMFVNGGGVTINVAHFEPNLDQLAAQLAPKMAAGMARMLASMGFTVARSFTDNDPNKPVQPHPWESRAEERRSTLGDLLDRKRAEHEEWARENGFTLDEGGRLIDPEADH